MTTGSPWFRDSGVPGPEPIPADPYGHEEPRQPYESTPYEQTAYEQTTYEQTTYTPNTPNAYEQQPAYEQQQAYQQTAYEPAYEPAYASYAPEETPQAPPAPRDETVALRAVETPQGPGRAERRRAAKGGGRDRGRGSAPAATAGASGAEQRPLSRVEARRAARAAKESVGVVASRIIGELFITFGVVMLLFVTYQLWWTNVLAGQETDRAKEQIEDTWAKGRDSADDGKPEAFEPGQGFAIMYIPKLDVVVPIAEGINKTKVLDKGMVGHYADGKLKTAMPSDKQGNFAVAGHRNTHGEPFRYVNQLKPGDPIVVETQDAYYTYEMASILPQTAPSNVSVIDPVPKGSGFTKPGRYITLTTCTPEFTSTYRMIVWGKMVEERPRSKGKPAALVG
ncbi:MULTISPECIES: class E sortase [Streptomyces]|uniref:Class E sortase n=1 Tax=Streptomyces venezuelae TaxID=54571 RepID=A0A5P2AW33_STRVZ|nr:class E sortase [Streptomyces venezuelae]QES21101.1 class E sortase [Streptomyces venezuelae]